MHAYIEGLYFPRYPLPTAKNPHPGPHTGTINIADMLFLRDPFFRQSPQGQS
jgi:hypothetical protein